MYVLTPVEEYRPCVLQTRQLDPVTFCVYPGLVSFSSVLTPGVPIYGTVFLRVSSVLVDDHHRLWVTQSEDPRPVRFVMSPVGESSTRQNLVLKLERHGVKGVDVQRNLRPYTIYELFIFDHTISSFGFLSRHRYRPLLTIRGRWLLNGCGSG